MTVMHFIGVAMILSGSSLLLGFLTPLASTLVGIGAAGTSLLWIPPPMTNLFEAPISTVMTAVMAASIVMMGPGAVSLDAHLFGRREIIIPRLPPTS